MNDWLIGLKALNGRGEAAVLVTVVATRGSTPREPGTKMTVGLDELYDTIGGGQLEHAAIESARLLLEQGEAGYSNFVERHKLDPKLGQCCGGIVDLLLERIPGESQDWIEALADARRERRTAFMATPVGGADKHVPAGPDDAPAGSGMLVERAMSTAKPVYGKAAGGDHWFVDVARPLDFHVALFGAGHVGKALAGVLGSLRCELTWLDSRRELFPKEVAANVRTEIVQRPELRVDECPPGTFYLVMTHSHPLDLAIVERILARDDLAYCGVIGSKSKRRNFEKQLRAKGVTDTVLNRLICPIGVAGISGKQPAEIAIAVAAEILQMRESVGSPSTVKRAVV